MAGLRPPEKEIIRPLPERHSLDFIVCTELSITLTTSNQRFHALIGCGRVAPTHVDAARYASPLSLRDVVDIDSAKAQAFAQQWGLNAVSLDGVLRDPTVVSVSVCTPHDTHFDLTKAALNAGKHVLLEKPAALEPAEVVELAAVAAKRSCHLFPIAQHRFDPLVSVARDLLASGDLGTIRMARVSLECVRDPAYYGESDWRGSWAREGGSVLMNQGYHFVDMLLWLLGPAVRTSAVMANLANRNVMETEDSLAATLDFQCGALGVISISGAAGGQWNNVIELVADQGSLAFDLSTPARVHRLDLSSKRALKHWRAIVAEAQSVIPMPVGVSYYGVTHRTHFQVLAEAIAGSEVDERCASIQQARGVVELINSIYRSARSGETLSVIPAGH